MKPCTMFTRVYIRTYHARYTIPTQLPVFPDWVVLPVCRSLRLAPEGYDPHNEVKRLRAWLAPNLTVITSMEAKLSTARQCVRR